MTLVTVNTTDNFETWRQKTNKIIGNAPSSKAVNFSVAEDEKNFINTASITVTLPDATLYPARELRFRNSGAYSLTSNASNVVPISSSTPGTTILSATTGKWAQLISNGTNWVIMSSN